MHDDHELRPVRVGVFRDLASADQAVARLFDRGYTQEQVSVISSDQSRVDELKRREGVKSEPTPASLTKHAAKEGSIVGGSIGALGGFALASTAVTGGASLIVAGPMFLLTTAAGVVLGSLIDGMRMRGIEKNTADFYDQALQDGMILVAVDISEEGNIDTPTRAEQVFEELNALPVELKKG